MKTFHKAPLALAITALLTAPAVLAQESGDNGSADGGGFTASSKIDSNFINRINVNLKHKSDTDKAFKVRVRVNENADFYAGSLVDGKQFLESNRVTNKASENNATVGSGSGSNATGNVGINVAAGDNNAQANDASLAANDAANVFGQAEIYSAQDVMNNRVINTGSPNDAVLGSGSLANASGNIGVNIAAGVSNAQHNALSASDNQAGGHARSTVGGVQQASDNNTTRTALTETYTNTTNVSLSGGMSNDSAIEGSYDGDWGQTNDVYPEIWTTNDEGTNHGSGSYWGHADFDDQGTAGQAGRFAGDEEGSVSFEAGDVALSGVVSGDVATTHTIYIANQNNATLGSGSLDGVSGNVGVNIAAGSNNMQRNSLSIASSLGDTNPGSGSPE